MAIKIDSVMGAIQQATHEAGIKAIFDLDDGCPTEKNYYIRTDYSVSGVVSISEGKPLYILEYAGPHDFMENCGFIETRFNSLPEMLAVLSWAVKVFTDIRKQLDNVL